MINKINFLFLLLYSYRKKHISIFFVSVILVATLSSVVFISSSLQKDLQTSLGEQADFTLQRYRAGKVVDMPESWIDEFLDIKGVSSVQGRIWGVHYYEPLESYFTIVGIDFYDTQIVNSLKNLIDDIDITKFQSKDYMIMGSGVKKLFDKYQYKDYYNFRPPDRSIKRVYMYGELPQNIDIFSSDIIFMDIDLAREILGIKKGFVSDAIVEVKNKDELEMVNEKLIISHFDMRIIKKSYIQKYYKNLFNYKGGVFLALFVTTLLTFMLILYQRYSMIWYIDSKEVAILRMIGWSVKDLIFLKLSENFIVALSAYLFGVLSAYFYVFVLDAPLLKYIFLGYKNLQNSTSFSVIIDFDILFMLFVSFVIPFVLAVIIPVFRVATSDASEVMR